MTAKTPARGSLTAVPRHVTVASIVRETRRSRSVPALMARARVAGEALELEYIDDSGAGRSIVSVPALKKYGVPETLVNALAG